MSTIPAELAVFPLPGTVLFPDALLSLHVFEPRYRELLKDVISGSGHLVVGVLKPGYEQDYDGSPEIYGTGCVGRIVERSESADGTSDIIVRGTTVVRIDSFVSERPYRVASVTPIPDDGTLAGADGAQVRAELQELLERACPGCVRLLRDGWPGDYDRSGVPELLHTLAMHLPVSVEQRLEWLACRGSRDRWLRMRQTLLELAEGRETHRRVLARYGDTRPEAAGRN